MHDDAIMLQLKADVAVLRGDVADLKQAFALVPDILNRIEAQIAATSDRAAHVIKQNDTLVRWATDDSDDSSWPVMLAGLTAVSDRVAAVERGLIALPHMESALAALADGQQQMRDDFAAHDRNVADRVARAAVVPTRQARGAKHWSVAAVALSLVVIAIHVLQAYQAGVFVAFLGG